MSAQQLRKGMNVVLPEGMRQAQLVVAWDAPDTDRDGDTSILLLDATHRVRGDTADRKVTAVATTWLQLIRQLSLQLTADLGATVTPLLPRAPRPPTPPAASRTPPRG